MESMSPKVNSSSTVNPFILEAIVRARKELGDDIDKTVLFKRTSEIYDEILVEKIRKALVGDTELSG